MKKQEIFKALRTDGHGWVVGDLIRKGRDIPYIRFSTGEGGYKDWMEVSVIPETVFEFTGLQDKNGVDIYEGDIIYAENYKPKEMTIYFLEGGFCLKWSDDCFPIDINHFFPSTGCQFKIIGNIHSKN